CTCCHRSFRPCGPTPDPPRPAPSGVPARTPRTTPPPPPGRCRVRVPRRTSGAASRVEYGHACPAARGPLHRSWPRLNPCCWSSLRQPLLFIRYAVAVCPVLLSSSRNDVHHREQADPHNVDEVPVVGDHNCRGRLCRRELAQFGSHEQQHEPDQATDHV